MAPKIAKKTKKTDTPEKTEPVVIAPSTPESVEEYIDRYESTPDPDSAKKDMVGDAVMLRQSPILRQFEDLSRHMHEDNHFGRDGKVTGLIMDNGKSPKCYYKRAEAWTDEDGNPVAAWAMHTSVFSLSEDEILRNFFHEQAHSHNGLAYLLNTDPKKSPDTSVNGAHSSKLFKSAAEHYFTKDSFITKEEVEKDTKTAAKKDGDRAPYGQTDINTIRATGFEFLPWVRERLATFNGGRGFDMSVFTVRRVMDEGTTRDSTKTVAVGCVDHHWDLEPGDRDGFAARIKVDDVAPVCKSGEHYEAIIRAAISAHSGDIGPNNVTGQFDSFLSGIEDRLPAYVTEPEKK
jgi:hypothetical protein